MTPQADPPRPPARRLIDGPFAVIICCALAAGTAVWLREGPERVAGILRADLYFVAKLLPKILGGVLLAIALSLMLPRDRVRAHLGPDSGLRGLVLAAAAGAVIPGGPSMTYPLAAGLVAAGVDLGAAAAMLTGWFLLGINRTIIWELSFLPADLVALRYIACLWVPIAAGLGVRALTRWLGPA